MASLSGSSLRGSRHTLTLQEICEVLEAALGRNGVAEDQAAGLSEVITLTLGDHFGGRQFYLPKGDALRKKLRNVRIYKMSRTCSVAELAKVFGFSEAHVYQILSEQREIHRRRRDLEERQGQLSSIGNQEPKA